MPRSSAAATKPRQLENPISADLDAMRPSAAALAARGGGAQPGPRICATLMLFEIGAQFECGMPEAQIDSSPPASASGEPPRHWTQSHPARRCVRWRRPMRWPPSKRPGADPINAPVQAGAALWYHPGRSGTMALGPKVLAYFGELHPRIVAAFRSEGSRCRASKFSSTPLPNPRHAPAKARAKLEASDLMAVERDFAFILDAGVDAD